MSLQLPYSTPEELEYSEVGARVWIAFSRGGDDLRSKDETKASADKRGGNDFHGFGFGAVGTWWLIGWTELVPMLSGLPPEDATEKETETTHFI